MAETDTLLPEPKPVASFRSAAWARRRRALRLFWRRYRRSAMGMWGLGLMIFFTLVALLAPLLAEAKTIDPSYSITSSTPAYHAPSVAYPFGTDYLSRSVLSLVIWGSRISL